MPRQGAAFATHRPSHWLDIAADATKDFGVYCVFVHDHKPFEQHHEVIFERLVWGGKYELIQGPPNSAKSTYGKDYVEWILGRDPNYRWLVVSETVGGPATQWVTDIGHTLAENERYHMVFGNLKGNSREWSTRSLRIRTLNSMTPRPPFPWLTARGRDPGVTNPNVRAAGWQMKIQGVRADGVVFDDLVSERTSMSAKQTAQIYKALHDRILSRLSSHPQERVLGFGQRFMPRDLYGLLAEHGVVVYDNNPQREGMHVMEAA
jgi:hypothetical protein